jgi:hypothetical protein
VSWAKGTNFADATCRLGPGHALVRRYFFREGGLGLRILIRKFKVNF